MQANTELVVGTTWNEADTMTILTIALDERASYEMHELFFLKTSFLGPLLYCTSFKLSFTHLLTFCVICCDIEEDLLISLFTTLA